MTSWRRTLSCDCAPQPLSDAPVGVDLERLSRDRVDRRLPSLVLSPAEREAVGRSTDPDLAFLRSWVRKEALVKVNLVSLATLRELDLSELPLQEEPGETHRRLRLDALHLLDWLDRSLRIVGTAVSTLEPQLVSLSELDSCSS